MRKSVKRAEKRTRRMFKSDKQHRALAFDEFRMIGRVAFGRVRQYKSEVYRVFFGRRMFVIRIPESLSDKQPPEKVCKDVWGIFMREIGRDRYLPRRFFK